MKYIVWVWVTLSPPDGNGAWMPMETKFDDQSTCVMAAALLESQNHYPMKCLSENAPTPTDKP